VTAAEHRLRHRSSDEAGGRRDDGLHQMHIVRFQRVGIQRWRANDLQSGFVHDRFNGLGAAFQQQPVVGPDEVAHIRL